MNRSWDGWDLKVKNWIEDEVPMVRLDRKDHLPFSNFLKKFASLFPHLFLFLNEISKKWFLNAKRDLSFAINICMEKCPNQTRMLESVEKQQIPWLICENCFLWWHTSHLWNFFLWAFIFICTPRKKTTWWNFLLSPCFFGAGTVLIMKSQQMIILGQYFGNVICKNLQKTSNYW